jgi:hypothetical protein
MKALGILAAAAFCAGAGFFAAALLSVKQITEWRDRFTRIRALAVQAGAKIPSWAMYADGRLITARALPCVKRGRLPGAALVFMICWFFIESTMAAAFAMMGYPLSPKGALFWGGAFGIQVIITAGILWSTWPIRRPTVTREFIGRWAEQFPMQSPNDPGFDPGEAEDRAFGYVVNLVAAMDVKIEQAPARR